MRALYKHQPNIFYGFIGYMNLGDEAIWQATNELFQTLALTPYTKPRFNYLKSLLAHKTKKSAMLGGGTLIGANKPDGSNGFRSDFHIVSNKAKYKIVFGTGVGPFSSDIPDWLKAWRYMLEGCDYVGVRGPRSQTRLKRIGIESEILGDIACQWTSTLDLRLNKRKKLGVNIGATKGLISEQGLDNYIEFLRQRISEKWDLIFYVINPDDEVLAKLMIDRLGNDSEIRSIYENTRKYLSSLNEVDYFIGTRLHSVILALTKPIPSIMLGYADKAYDFMESIGMESFCVDVNTVSVDKLNDVFANLTSNNFQQEIFDAMAYFKDLQKIQSKNIIAQIGRF